MKSTSNYSLINIPYAPFPYLSPAGQESPVIYSDDQYGDKVTLAFPFCFYDSVFYKATVGSNGLLTFDTTNANCSNAYTIGPPIPGSGGGSQCNQFSTYYPRAAIMAAYSDLDPSTPTASPSDRKIQWRSEGVAPCRKFVVSFYHIGVYGVPYTSCPSPWNTFQIVLHESTGTIDVFFEQKVCLSSTNGGNGIFGIQDWTRTKATFYPGRNPGVWSENNTGYRYVPSGSGSRYVISELLDLSNNVIATADTLTTTPGLLDLNFLNVCPPAGNSTYVVKTTYSACHNSAIQLISYDTVFINRSATQITTTVNKTDVMCNSGNTGMIIVTPPTMGTPPYEYSLDGLNWQPGNTFSNLTAGTYTVHYRDSYGCEDSQQVVINEPTAIAVNSNTTNASCDGGNDGLITITTSGGNPNYQYSIDGTNFQISNVFNVAPGNYTVTVKDDNGCTSTQNVTVGMTTNLTITPIADKTICEGTSTQLQFNSNATQFSWSPTSGLSNTSISNPVANPSTTTQYIITATLGRCSENDTMIVNVNAAPIPNAGSDGFICYGQSFQLRGSGGSSYSWSPATYLSSTTDPNAMSTPNNSITYSLMVTDANGCQSLITDDVTVDVTPPIVVQTFPNDTILYAGDQFQLLATSIANMYSWTPSVGLNNPSVPDPVITAGVPGDVIIYKVTASTIAGCKGEGYVKVQVYKGPDIYMPTAFTPNSDGKNDKFKPVPVGIKKINYFKVFNRWGQLLYSTNSLHEGWDGKYTGLDQSTGVYVWMVQGVTKDGKVITKKGTVTLIR